MGRHGQIVIYLFFSMPSGLFLNLLRGKRLKNSNSPFMLMHKLIDDTIIRYFIDMIWF